MKAQLAPMIGALAGVGLDRPADLDAVGWTDRLDEVFGHGLAGLMAHAWQRGQMTLDRSTVDRLEARLEREAVHGLRLEAEVLRLTPLLERYGAVVLKGPVLAHGAYPDPSWRPFTDLDVLVATRWLPAMIERLAGYGYRRPRPDPSRGFLLRVAKATALDHPNGLMVDLHRTLVAGNLGEGIDVDELLAERTVIWAGSVPVPAPRWESHLIEVALHAIIGDGLSRAISLRDVVQVAAHPELDRERVVVLAERWDVADAVAASIEAAHLALGMAIPAPFGGWASRVDTEGPLLQPGSQSGRTARSRLDELRGGGIRRRLTLLRSLVAPEPEFLRWKYGDARLSALYRWRWRELRHRRDDGRIP